MKGTNPSMSALPDFALKHQIVLFEESDALAVVRALVANGFEARVERMPFAGEDSEDHPWAVCTDAPHVMLELAADQFDGWVVYEDSAVTAPLNLPAAPKRHHGPPPTLELPIG